MAVPISNVTRRQVYAPSGAGGAGPYAFTFEILANTDIAVYKDDVLLTLTTHYTVTINANGTGSVTITAAGLALTPTSPSQYAIVGNRTIQRTTDFVTGGDFFANTLNDEIDQQTIFAQQNAEGLQRALAAPQTDPTSINMTLPRAALRANKALGFDGNGNPVISDTLGTNRGNWTAGVLYYARDIVKDTTNNNIWQCLVQHTSSGSQPINTNADSAKWSLLVDAASATASASAAASSASAASTSASNASTSASNASTSASNASTSASNAAGSASAASISASNAAASYDSFDDRYLGPKSSAPSVDNDGNSLLTGALYWDTALNQMRVWSGTAWVNVNASASNTRTAITATAGQTVLTVATYTPGTNTMVVYVNGVKLNASEYTETNATTITVTTGLALNDEVEVFSYRVNEVGTLGASSVTIADTGNYYTGGNAEAALEEIAIFQYGQNSTVLKAYGDSITKGEAVANPFPSLIGTNKGWSVTNYGINGAQTHDVAKPLYGSTIGDYDNVTVACGINNMRVSGGSATLLKYFQESHAALLAFAAIPNSKKIMATDARISYTGTWSSNDTYANGVSNRFSITQNDTARFTITGSVLYIGLTMVENKTGQVKVTVDGVDKGIYSCAAAGITTPLGQSLGPKLIRIALPQSGRHEVTLTITSATGSNNNVFLDWVAGNDQAAGPKVYVGNVTFMAAAGYAFYGGSDALTKTYNRVIYENAALLANDGLRIFTVDSNSVIDPLTDLADNLHPTQAGYIKIANKFVERIETRVEADAVLPFRAKNLTTAENAAYVGANGEVTFDTTLGVYYIHDSVTAGGRRLLSFTSSDENTAVGYQAANLTAASKTSVAVGFKALFSNVGGDSNCAVGNQALYTSLNANYNCAYGFGAMYFNVSGSNNAAFGYQSLFKSVAGFNTAFGYKTLWNTVAGDNNVAIGHNAVATNVSGSYNTAVGSETLNASTGDLNTAIGFGSLYGTDSGTNNTAIGARSGFGPGGTGANTTGSNNSFVGNEAVGSSPTVSNQVTLGNSSIASLRCQVALTVLSDERDKIRRGDLPGLDFVLALDTFLAEWNKRDGSENAPGTFASLSAQNLLAAQKKLGLDFGLVSEDNPDKLEATYERMIPMLVKAIQELSNKIVQLNNQ